MKTPLIILVIICAFSCVDPEDAPKLSDVESIQGAWLGQTESQNGIKKNVNFLYTFRGDTLTFRDETGVEVKYSFRLDTTGNPRFIIIQPEDTGIHSAPVSVGYELDGDSLKIVVAPPGLRPAEISDKNNQELIICKRKGS